MLSVDRFDFDVSHAGCIYGDIQPGSAQLRPGRAYDRD